MLYSTYLKLYTVYMFFSMHIFLCIYIFLSLITKYWHIFIDIKLFAINDLKTKLFPSLILFLYVYISMYIYFPLFDHKTLAYIYRYHALGN